MEVQTVSVLKERFEEAKHELDKLIRKAHRYGNPDIAYRVIGEHTEIHTHTDWDGEERRVKVTLVDIEITGDAPRIGNHEFLARIEFGANGNLLDKRPGAVELDIRFRSSHGECDHCKKVRLRNEVFVVRNLDTNEQLQIGRQCLRDYLGIDDPSKVAHRFAFFHDVMGFDEEFSRGGRSIYFQSLEGLLTLTSVCIRLFGWCSKGQAQKDESLTPTVSYVTLAMSQDTGKDKEALKLRKKIIDAKTEADVQTAIDTIEWVRALSEKELANSDYLYNLSVIFAEDFVNDPRRLGLAVSGVSAMFRAQDSMLRRTKEYEAAKVSAHVGIEGERLKGLKVTQIESRFISTNQFGDIVLIKFRDENGNLFDWFTGHGTGLQIGEKATIDGTVKRHSDFNGINSTVLSRVKIAL